MEGTLVIEYHLIEFLGIHVQQSKRVYVERRSKDLGATQKVTISE